VKLSVTIKNVTKFWRLLSIRAHRIGKRTRVILLITSLVFGFSVGPFLYVHLSVHVLVMSEEVWWWERGGVVFPMMEEACIDAAYLNSFFQFPDANTLGCHDVLMLLDVPNKFTNCQVEAIRSFVSHGGTLLLVGGDHSFHSDYNQSVWAEILPAVPTGISEYGLVSVNAVNKTQTHPVLSGIDLDDLTFQGVNVIHAKPEATVLLKSQNDQVILTLKEFGEGVVFVLPIHNIHYNRTFVNSAEWRALKPLLLNIVTYRISVWRNLFRSIVGYASLFSALVFFFSCFIFASNRFKVVVNGDDKRGKKKHVMALSTFTVAMAVLMWRWWNPGVPAQLESSMWISTTEYINFNLLHYGYGFPSWTWSSLAFMGLPIMGNSSALWFAQFWLAPLAMLIGSTFAFKLVSLAIYALSGFFMYIFAYRFSKNFYGALFAGLLYEFNYFVSCEFWIWGHLDNAVAYMAFPLVFLVVEWFLESKKIRDVTLAGLFTAFLLLASQEMRMLLTFLLFVILPYFLLKGINRENLKCMFVYGATISLGIACYWLPFLALFSEYGLPSFGIDWTLISSNAFTHALALYQSVPGGSVEHPQALGSMFSLTLFITLALAFSALLFRRDRKTCFLVALAIFAVFFSCGVYAPIFKPFMWLQEYTPVLAFNKTPFRSGAGLAMFAFSALSSVSISGLMKLTRGKYISYVKLKQLLLFSVLITTVIGPVILNTGLYYTFSNANYAPEMNHAYQWIKMQGGDYAILRIPVYADPMPGKDYHHYWPTSTIHWGPGLIDNYLSASYGLRSTTAALNFLQAPETIRDYQVYFVSDALVRGDTAGFQAALSYFYSVKYIIIYKDMVQPMVLETIEKVCKKGFEEGEITVYINPNATGRILVTRFALVTTDNYNYTTLKELWNKGLNPTKCPVIFTDSLTHFPSNIVQSPEQLKETDIPEYSWEMVGPAEYRVHVNGTAWVTVAENIFPGWKGLLDGKEVQPLTANGIFPIFSVPIGEHTLIVKYDPPLYPIKLGIIISGLTVIVIVFYAVIDISREKHLIHRLHP